ncbi:MAG: copper-translocating P-type ATPase [Alphaproteobacteria bacterium]|nr:MAG: copper-translocating P-type ATPase [Alphaproteobacteria bacterium]
MTPFDGPAAVAMPAVADAPACAHCGEPVAGGGRFCCPGCAAAYATISGLGLQQYYDRRSIDPTARPLKPEEDGPATDHSAYVRHGPNEIDSLHLMVEGLHCAACVWLIESVLGAQPGVVKARLSMTTRRLLISWRAGAADANALVAALARLGYRLVPYDPELLGAESDRRDKALLRAMAVAGFAAGNVMLLSVSIWAGHVEGMSPATRDLFHWISALIVLPAVAYSGRPFFASALAALKARRANMDVPISLAVILTPAISLAETFRGGEHAYFDSAITLLFFLLVGRYLDSRARGRARSAAEQLVALGGAAVTVLAPDGSMSSILPRDARPGMIVLVPAGGRIGIDGRIVEGESSLDTSLISGESLPAAAGPGDPVFAGTLNLSAPLRLEVTAVGEETLLAEIVRLMESAEQGRARYVALADRVARLYSPVVHSLAALTFAGWMLAGASWQPALLNAIAVLIITCPCALALAVPVVQVVASGRLMRRGILLKSATALERLAEADTVVFDKTGTLTTGRLALVAEDGRDPAALELAASLAAASSHPLARALVRAAPRAAPARGVREVPGGGLVLPRAEGEIRLGSRSFCGVAEEGDAVGPELWLARPGAAPVRFAFRDDLRPDAAEVVSRLRGRNMRVELLSGDREATVGAVARALGIPAWRGRATPQDKAARLAELAAAGRRVLMVGDGLNDAPALAAAHVSMSPASAADISRTTADVVFQGEPLAPVPETLAVAGAADRLVRQNIALALLYNAIAVPLAVLGFVTPLVAAIAMSSSSVLVIANALRLARRRLA